MYVPRWIDFWPKFSAMFQRKRPLTGGPNNMYSQNLGNPFVKYLWRMIKFFSKLKWRSRPVLKMSSFTDILQEFCQDFKQRCTPFWNFQNTCFTESLSTIMWFCMRVETTKRPSELTHITYLWYSTKNN